MKKSVILFFLTISISIATFASDLTPVAAISHNVNRDFFFNGESITFDGSGSVDRDEGGSSITAYIWVIDGTTYAQTTSPTKTVTFSLSSGVDSRTITVKLKVKDDEGNWSSYLTKTYTLRRQQDRNFFVKDHLGSVRVTVDEAGEPLGFDDYYPFGLTMPGRSSNSANPNDNYKFTGHERDDEAGLTLDYMNARNYDPVIGRFMQIDPKHELYPGATPYHYTLNNPLRFTDPTGECINELPCPKKVQATQYYKGTVTNQGAKLRSGTDYLVGTITYSAGNGSMVVISSSLSVNELGEISDNATVSSATYVGSGENFQMSESSTSIVASSQVDPLFMGIAESISEFKQENGVSNLQAKADNINNTIEIGASVAVGVAVTVATGGLGMSSGASLVAGAVSGTATGVASATYNAVTAEDVNINYNIEEDLK